MGGLSAYKSVAGTQWHLRDEHGFGIAFCVESRGPLLAVMRGVAERVCGNEVIVLVVLMIAVNVVNV